MCTIKHICENDKLCINVIHVFNVTSKKTGLQTKYIIQK